MKKLLILLLFPLIALSCSKEESEKELILSRNYALIHSCKGEPEYYECYWGYRMIDTILVLNAKGNIRVEPQNEYIKYGNMTEDVCEKTLNVLNIRVKSDTIFIKYIWDEITVMYVDFNVYDEDNGFATFNVRDPALI